MRKGLYPLGRVIDLIPSRIDAKIRSIKIKLAKGIQGSKKQDVFVRDITNIFMTEITDQNQPFV